MTPEREAGSGMDTKKFLEEAEFDEIYEDEAGGQYVKRRNATGTKIQLHKLSKNGLAVDGYSPVHKRHYLMIKNPGFKDDSDTAKVIDEIEW